MSTSGFGHLTGSTIELLVSCTDLADLDDFTKSDPMCVLFYKQYGQWTELGRTEAIKNTLNPKFVESFIIDFDPALQYSLMFSVYDIDNSSTDLRRHDFVGSVETTLYDLLDPHKDQCTICKTLRVAVGTCGDLQLPTGTSRARGLISITSEVVRRSRDKVSLHVGGHKLAKNGKFLSTKPDVYLEISRSIDNVNFHPVYRTETIRKTQNPRWRPLEISLQRLCNGDWDRHIEMAVWHYSGSGDYKMLGQKVTTLRELKTMRAKRGHYHEIGLVPRKKRKHKNSVKISICGQLRFFNISIDCQYSLMEFIRGGLSLNLMIGIDFTSSNGRLGETHCLHDLTNIQENEYIGVLESLCAMVANCSKDQRVSMFGFGARVDNSNTVSHCFPLSNDWDNISVNGINSAIKLYKKTAKRIRFAGPSKLKPMLAMAESLSVREPTQEKQVYNTLIILTDGIVNDMDDLIERLVSISHLPLSVLFVGVGRADFSLMEPFSYHDFGILTCKKLNIKSSRKHTHFVPFRKESENSVGSAVLAGDAFAVLSRQIIEYMKSKDISPNKPAMSSAKESSVSLENFTKDENKGLNSNRRSVSNISQFGSRASLCRNLSGISNDPKCPTCGSLLDLTQSYTDLSIVNVCEV